MGCGGSKEDVAVGNTLSRQNPFRGKSNFPSSKTIAASSTNVSTESIESNSSPADVGGIEDLENKVVIAEGKNDQSKNEEKIESLKAIQICSKVGERHVSKESIDEYFSPRKDEDAISTDTAEGIEHSSHLEDGGTQASPTQNEVAQGLDDASSMMVEGDEQENQKPKISEALDSKDEDHTPKDLEEGTTQSTEKAVVEDNKSEEHVAKSDAKELEIIKAPPSQQ